MRVDEIAPGLWRWTGLHPAWTPAEGGPDGWEQEVGSVYFEAPDAVVVFDPLVPPEDRERFLEALDRDVERTGKPLTVLLTTESHGRSADELVGRYGGVRSPDALPTGVEAIDTGWGGELLYWLPGPRTLVAGDVMLGDGVGGVRLPDAWLGDDREQVRTTLLPLIDLPVEHILVAHGDPVLADGHVALVRALAAHAPSAA
jgi:glyoxylase-like metal-dependent hydrolase (beta-lactamase superfamily II)